MPGADLVVAGGPPRAKLRGDLGFRRLAKLADSLGVTGQVTFAGQVGRAALPPLLRSADLLVSVSEYDPTGIALRPGDGLRHAGHRLRDRRPGRRRGRRHHRHPGPARAARRCSPSGSAQLLAHPMLLEAFSVAAADRARSRYSWDRIAHETLAVYDTAVDKAAAMAA